RAREYLLGPGAVPAILDTDVLARSPSQFFELPQKYSKTDVRFLIRGGRAHQHADAPHGIRLLRLRRERPRRRRAAEQRNELAPLHRADPKPKDRGSIAGQSRASQQKRPTHVRFGSKADNASLRSYVRFAPESGQTADVSMCLLCAMCGRLQV